VTTRVAGKDMVEKGKKVTLGTSRVAESAERSEERITERSEERITEHSAR
jgi:hypothetical protein